MGIDNFNDYYSPQVKEFNIQNFHNNKKFRLYRKDISNRSDVQEIFKQNPDTDAVVHLAAWAGVTYSVEHPHTYVVNNILGTNNLVDQCLNHKIKNFIFASTSSIYGDNPTPFKEEMDTSTPNAPYPATKKASEVMLYTAAKNHDLNVTVFRFFNPLGPYLRPDMALPKLIRSAEYKKVFELWQDPNSSSRDYTYINDMLKAIESVIKKPQKYEIMNLGNSSPVSLSDLMDCVEKITGKEVETKKKYLPGQMKETFADIKKAKALIGYNPITSLEDMVKIYYGWFLNQPDWYKKGDF